MTFNKAIAMFKIAYNKSPEYLCDMYKLRNLKNNNDSITLRSVTNRDYCIPNCKLEL